MTKLNPYLTFEKNCREAMEFYKECLGKGEFFIQTVGDSPMAKDTPEEMHERVMHASIVTDDFAILASDLVGMPGEEYVKGNNIALTFNCESEEEAQRLFKNFSKGGKIVMPLEEQFWAKLYGEIVDKFGIKWLFNVSKEKM